MLDSGDVSALDELAERCDVDRSYVSRVPKLTALAPDIIELVGCVLARTVSCYRKRCVQARTLRD